MDFINALSKSWIHIFLLRRSGAFLFDIYVPLFCLIVGVNSLSQFYATILQLAHPTICRHQRLIHCSPFCKPTKPNLPNQTYQTKPTKPNLSSQTKPNLPNLLNQTKFTGEGSQRLGPQLLWQ